MRFTLWAGCLAVLVLAPQFSGCGGGGGGGGSTPPPSPPPAPPPLIVAQSFGGAEDTDLSASLVLRPGATASVAVTTAPTRGTLTAFSTAGVFTYRPNPNLAGPDTFTVEATDSSNNRVSAVVTVTITAVNDAPVAVGEVLEVPAGPTATLTVIGNDSDVDDTALTVVIPAAAVGAAETNPAVGTATVDASNRIQLSLPAGFHGITRVNYQVRDAASVLSEVVSAWVFVGTPRFDVWYQGPAGMHPSQLFVSDFSGTRQVTQFVMPRKLNGTQLSANKNVVMIGENDGDQLRDIWTVGTRTVEAPVRMTPGHDATQSLDQFILSPNGAWVAYVVVSGGLKQLWLVERANPAGRRQIPLRAGHDIASFSPLKFSADSNALYYVTRSGPNSDHLNRAAVADPLHPVAIYPLANESAGLQEWFLSPDDSYVVVRYVDVVRVSVADPTVRIPLNAPLPVGRYIGSVNGDETATRFVYLTLEVNDAIRTDDELWMCDTGQPGVSTLVVPASPARTGPMGPTAFRPDRNAMLVDSWSAVPGSFQIDIAEVSLSPADGVMRQISPPRPVNSRTSSIASYLGNDSVILTVLESSLPTRFLEARRGSFDTPVTLVEPGIMSIAPRYSADKSIIAITHSRNQSGDPNHYGVLINRTAPGSMVRVTPGVHSGLSPFFFDIVERN
jgi:VCBS repeat-containing protein